MKQNKRIRAVDLFAGAGGASTGLLRACRKLGFNLDLLAINHWPIAIETHRANHPKVVHLTESVEQVDPMQKEFVDPVSGLVFKNTGRFNILLAGPECTHFSTARGGRPVNSQSRATAWSILKWAQELYIDTLWIENVPEFKTWGPIGANGRPLKSKKGETYRAFKAALESLGYRVDDKILNSADYGAATTRRRLFILAHRGHNQVFYPAPTHAKAQTHSTLLESERATWTTAREKVIDWSIKGKSIFNRRKPLRPATMLRIIAGLEKFGGPELKPFLVVLRKNCIDCYVAEQILAAAKPMQAALLADSRIAVALSFHFLFRCGALTSMFLSRNEAKAVTANTLLEPFLITLRNHLSASSVDEPIKTLTSAGTHHALVQPELVKPATLVAMEHGGRAVDPEQPLPTITTAKGGAFGVAEAVIVHTTHGGRENDVDAPVPCVTGAHRGEMALAQAYVLGQQSEAALRPDDQPIPTVAAGGAIALVETELQPEAQPDNSCLIDASFGSFHDDNEGRRAHSVDEPLGVLPGSNRYGKVDAALIVDAGFGRDSDNSRSHSVDQPIGCLPGSNRYGKVDATLVPLYNEREGQEPRCHSTDQPVPTIPASGGGKFGVAEAVIVKTSHVGGNGDYARSANEPLMTVTGRPDEQGVAHAFLLPHQHHKDNERADSVDTPLRTITAVNGRRFGLAQPCLTKFYGNDKSGQSVDEPIDTITTKDRHALATAIIHSAGGPNVEARSVDEPANTVLTRDHMALTEAIITAGGPEGQGRNANSVDGPMPTILTDDRHALVEAEVSRKSFISPQRSNAAPHSVEEPVPTLTASQHMMLVDPFVLPNNTNNVPQSVDVPLPTVTGANRLALVQPVIKGMTLEIYFRMLQSHELSRAMGFPDEYEFTGNREDVVKQIGNAWSGELAEALSIAALQPYIKTPIARKARKAA